MLFQNPPRHTRLRLLTQHAFTWQRIHDLRDRIQQLTDELIDHIGGRSEIDLVNELSLPLPVRVIAELLGVPDEDRCKLAAWSAVVTINSFNFAGDPRGQAEAQAARAAFDAYCHQLIAERRTHPRDDLLSSLITATEAGDRLTEMELQTTVLLLLIAGHVTTVNLIANGVLALLRHPVQMQRLRSEPRLIESAIEEFLRYDSPLQVTYRTVLEEFDFDGRRFSQGEIVAMFLGAANRDPAQFERPNELDIARSSAGHIAFGGGIHFCLGAALARLEGLVAIQTILRRMPRLALANQDLTYPPSYVLRGPVALWVTY